MDELTKLIIDNIERLTIIIEQHEKEIRELRAKLEEKENG